MKFLHIIDEITKCTYRYSLDAISIRILGDILHVITTKGRDTFNLKKCTCEVLGK